MENIDSIGKYTFFEIIYYKDKSDELIEKFQKYKFNSTILNNQFKSEVESTIYNYFSGNYKETINNAGQISEELLKEICLRIKGFVGGEVDKELPSNFGGLVDSLENNLCNPLRNPKNPKNRKLEDCDDKIKLLKNIDKAFDLIRVYRNQSSHPEDHLRGKEDAKIILDNLLYSLELIDESGVLN